MKRPTKTPAEGSRKGPVQNIYTPEPLLFEGAVFTTAISGAV